MSWKEKAVALYKRFGPPAKFAAKLVVGAVVPGGSAVIDLIGQALDCVDDTAKGMIDEDRQPAATAEDLKRLEEMLDVLSGDLAEVMAKVAAQQGQPDAVVVQARDEALAANGRCKAALNKLDHLARGIEGLHAKADQTNAKLDEVMRWMCIPRGLQQQHKPGELYTNSLGMKFAWIPPGAFLMGSPPGEWQRHNNETQHKVTLTKGFWMGVHPVTQAQWQAVMGDNPSHFCGDDLPVEGVRWEVAVAFCEALGKRDGHPYRLPTEAEWEYACRAGTATPFHFGATITTNLANYNGRYSYGDTIVPDYRDDIDEDDCEDGTTPVGIFPPNAWGLYDMHGNVHEWCADWPGPYPSSDVVDPQGANSRECHVVRGGCWELGPRDCRSADRGWFPIGEGVVGCRVCLRLD